MKPLRIRIRRIVDFGLIVSLIGVDIDIDADRLTLHLEMLPEEDAHEVQLIDGGNTLVQNEMQAANAKNAPLSIGEIEP